MKKAVELQKKIVDECHVLYNKRPNIYREALKFGLTYEQADFLHDMVREWGDEILSKVEKMPLEELSESFNDIQYKLGKAVYNFEAEFESIIEN